MFEMSKYKRRDISHLLSVSSIGKTVQTFD